MGNSVRHVIRDGRSFTITYDEYDVVDTIQRRDGIPLTTKNKDVKFILNHADEILAFAAVNSITYI